MESTFAVPVCFYWAGNLGEQEVLWGHEPISECFHGFLEFSQTLTSVSITQRKCYINIFFRKQPTGNNKGCDYYNLSVVLYIVTGLYTNQHNYFLGAFFNTMILQYIISAAFSFSTL